MLNSLSPVHQSALVSLIDGPERSETFSDEVTGPGPGNKREHLCRFGWRSQSWQDLPLPPHWLAGAPCTLRKSSTTASCNTQSMARRCRCGPRRALSHARNMWRLAASRPALICTTRIMGAARPIGRAITSTTAITRSQCRCSLWSRRRYRHRHHTPHPRPSLMYPLARPRSPCQLAVAAAEAASLEASSVASSAAAAAG